MPPQRSRPLSVPTETPILVPPSQTPGSAHWLRVMQTKESQWRLLNTLALHELSTQEREACQLLDTLSARLDALTQATAALERLVAHCNKKSAQHRYAKEAAPYVARASAALAEAMPGYIQVMDGVLGGGGVEVGKVGEGFGGELERFRGIAKGFRQRIEGVEELVGVCEAMEELVGVVGGVGNSILEGAERCVEGGVVGEVGRVAVTGRVVEMRGGRNVE